MSARCSVSSASTSSRRGSSIWICRGWICTGEVSRLARSRTSLTGVTIQTPVVEVRGLVKTFGRARALDGLDLEVAAGEVHGFLGPNGAGKSTALRILLGLLHKDAGEVRLLGGDPWRDGPGLHRRLAYVPGDVNLWPNLSGGQIVDLLIRMRGADPARSRRDELVERFGLDVTKRARAYSKGNRQKVALVAALATEPELLLLDEPTSGLDPLMEQVFNDCVAEHVARGATVLLSSHILSEVDRLADRVTIIRDGRTVQSGRISDLRHLSRSRISATLTGPAPDLSRLPGVHDLHTDGDRLSCTAQATALPAVLEALTAAGVVALTSSPPTLEELFLDAYRSGEKR
ncbi:ABC transporter ATP-binding protein [Nocardioides sp. zg-ZUI104]|nr:ABC transporter ATP-binding protein [Nocardioides faecalis]